MSMSKVVERAVEVLCKHYNLPVDEAKGVVSKKKTKKMIEKPSTLVPFLGKVDGWCDGLKLTHGLYSQCTNKPMATGELCKTCQKQADANEHGKPNCGLASERADDMENWRDPKNRAPTHFGNLAAKMELNVDDVLSECKRVYSLNDDYELDGELLEVKKQTRGRPKKVNPIVSDTDDEGEPAKKPRGRPKKAKKQVVDVTNNGDDLISTLVAQAKKASEEQSVASESEVASSSESEGESGSESEGESKPKKKTTKKAKLSDEEKAAAKEAKEAEKAKKAEEKKAAKEAEKAKKAEEKKAAKEAEKAKKAEEKKAAKEAEKAQKAEEKKAAKKTKKAEEKVVVAEEELKADAEELSADEAVSEPEDEVRVELKTIGGVEYLIDDDGVVYDKNTQEPIGTYVADEDRIEECEFDEPELERS
jgi:hypothetical protein